LVCEEVARANNIRSTGTTEAMSITNGFVGVSEPTVGTLCALNTKRFGSIANSFSVTYWPILAVSIVKTFYTLGGYRRKHANRIIGVMTVLVRQATQTTVTSNITITLATLLIGCTLNTLVCSNITSVKLASTVVINNARNAGTTWNITSAEALSKTLIVAETRDAFASAWVTSRKAGVGTLRVHRTVLASQRVHVTSIAGTVRVVSASHTLIGVEITGRSGSRTMGIEGTLNTDLRTH